LPRRKATPRPDAVRTGVVPCGKECRARMRTWETATRDHWRYGVLAVIRDWYIDGVFNSPHHCRAIRLAIEEVPTSGSTYSRLNRDLSSLERRTCG
jgi:hypothetical protein